MCVCVCTGGNKGGEKGKQSDEKGGRERRGTESEGKIVCELHSEPIMNVFPLLFDGPHETVPGGSRDRRGNMDGSLNTHVHFHKPLILYHTISPSCVGRCDSE